MVSLISYFLFDAKKVLKNLKPKKTIAANKKGMRLKKNLRITLFIQYFFHINHYVF